MKKQPASYEGNRFSGKTALVTGAASGLGRALAAGLAEAGADVAVVDINEDGLQDTAAMVQECGVRCQAWLVDVSRWEDMENMAAEVLKAWDHIDILVNNAGVGVGGELKDVPMESIEWITGINLKGEIYGTKLFLPRMIERKQGHIVNAASLSPLVVLPFHIAYTTTKFGLAGFSEALWCETRRHGIGVTLVCPGSIKTNIMAGTRSYATGKGQKRMEEKWGDLLEKTGMEPEAAAGSILRGIEKNRFLLLLGSEAYLLYYLRRFFPNFARRAVASITGRLAKE